MKMSGCGMDLCYIQLEISMDLVLLLHFKDPKNPHVNLSPLFVIGWKHGSGYFMC